MLSLAVAGLRARGARTVLAALGVLAASVVVGTAATVGYGLSTGFDRAAARAGLPDVIARFDPEATQPEWALAYEWDIVMRATPFEE